MATYLVTGGCGFIGSHLSDALIAGGHSVRILDDLSSGKRENTPPEAEISVGDITDTAIVRRLMASVDGCFHLAAIASVQRSVEDWAGTHRVNLTGTINVLDAARIARGGKPVPVAYASSAAVYGDNSNVPLGEDAITLPLTSYGADKLGSEQHARVAAVVHGVPTVGLRFFNIYGPRQDPKSPYSGVISIFVYQILKREGVMIHGDGGQVRDFVYVADCVAHVIAAMDRARSEAEVYNVCTGSATSVHDLVVSLGALTGTEPVVQHGPSRAGDIRRSIGNPTRARAALGLTADTQIRDGLRKLIESTPGSGAHGEALVSAR